MALGAFFTYGPGCLTCCAFGCSRCNSEVATGGLLFFSSFGRIAMIATMIAIAAYLSPVIARAREIDESVLGYSILVGCIEELSTPDLANMQATATENL